MRAASKNFHRHHQQVSQHHAHQTHTSYLNHMPPQEYQHPQVRPIQQPNRRQRQRELQRQQTRPNPNHLNEQELPLRGQW